MDRIRACYIDGDWRDGTSSAQVVVTNAADGGEMARFQGAGVDDAGAAVLAARRAWPEWSGRPVAERTALLRRAADLLEQRIEEIATSASLEIGTPAVVSAGIHGHLPVAAIRDLLDRVDNYEFAEEIGNSLVVREPAGVAVTISAWNYPLYQLATKVVPALAAGCTVVAKPSELAPLTPLVFFEVLAEAGLPAGVANLVIGTGREAGEPLVRDPEVDVVSFTGSTGVGQRIGELAAARVAKVALELGGKSASVILDDADLATAVPGSVGSWLINNSQTCAALTRMIVPRNRQAEIEQAVVEVLANYPLGHPLEEGILVGPVISRAQQQRVEEYIELGLQQGARLVAGGLELPAGLPEGGHYVRPTVFADVAPDHRIAQEEIFGPVLCIIPVDSEEEAIEVANGTAYGLSGAVWSVDRDRAISVARQLRTGQVAVNGGAFNVAAPFGGYKQSGVGREGGSHGFEEFLETKAIQL